MILSAIWKSKKYLLILFVVYFCAMSPLSAAADKVLRVGVWNFPPYSIVEGNIYRGISIDIWSLVSRHLNLKYQFVPMGNNINDNVLALKQGKVDVLAGPVNANYTRSLLVGFTRPYVLSSVRIVVPLQQLSIMEIVALTFAKMFGLVILLGLVVVVIYAHLIWYFERGKVRSIPIPYFEGVTFALWSGLLKKGIEDMPQTMSGRLIHFIWVGTIAFIITLFYAAMTASFQVSFSSIPKLSASSDFSNKQLVAVQGQISYYYAKNAGLNVIPVKDRETAIDMLLTKKADGFVGLSASLHYYIDSHHLNKKIGFTPDVLKTSLIAFVLPLGDPLIPKINAEIAYLEDYDLVSRICQRYLSKEVSTLCL